MAAAKPSSALYPQGVGRISNKHGRFGVAEAMEGRERLGAKALRTALLDLREPRRSWTDLVPSVPWMAQRSASPYLGRTVFTRFLGPTRTKISVLAPFRHLFEKGDTLRTRNVYPATFERPGQISINNL